MNFSDMSGIVSEITSRTGDVFEISKDDIGSFSAFKYPKFIPFMKFTAKSADKTDSNLEKLAAFRDRMKYYHAVISCRE